MQNNTTTSHLLEPTPAPIELLLLAWQADTKHIHHELSHLDRLVFQEITVSNLAEAEHAVRRPCDFVIVDGRSPLSSLETLSRTCLDINRKRKLFLIVDDISVEESVRLMRMGVCGIVMDNNLSQLAEWIDAEIRSLSTAGVRRHNGTAEVSVHDNEARRYRFLAENVTDMISRHTADGIYTDATPSSLTLTGYEPNELIGTPAYNYFHQDDLERIKQSHRAILDESIIYTVDYRFRHKNGYYIWLETTSHMIKDEVTGVILEIMAVSRDVSERKAADAKLAEANQRLKLATEVASIGVWEWDFTNEKMVWDRQMFDMYGVPFEGIYEVPLETWELIILLEDLPSVRKAVRRVVLDDRLPYDIEFKIALADGRIRYIQANAIVLRDDDGRAERMVGINLDVTDSREAKTKLLSALEKEKELGDLKSRFVSMASHEFRTPLATILATTESLSVYRDRMSQEQIDSRLAKIRSQVDHMKEIMEDVLSLARIQADQLMFRPEVGDLESLCHEIAGEFDIHAEYHGRIVYTSCERPMMGMFDPRLMRHVISNLVSNGLKYSDQQDSVTVELCRNENRIEIVISDQGIGITLSDLDRIAEPFHRGENVGMISGTGLGLSIATRAIEAHDGNLSFVSKLNAGSVATASIPLSVFEVS